MEKREGQPQPIDLSQLFISGSESDFMEQLHMAGNQDVRIEFQLDQLTSNLWQMRLKKFLLSGARGGRRTAVVQASQQEAEAFKNHFPGVEWKITDQKQE